MEDIIKELCSYILNNIDDEITMDMLEGKFYYSKYYIIHIFKMYTGCTIREFINTVKVLKTVNPLLFTDDTILKIALNNGFNSQEYYSEKFKDVIGVSPLRFRKEFQNVDEFDDVNELKQKRQYLLYLRQYEEMIWNNREALTSFSKVKKLEQ